MELTLYVLIWKDILGTPSCDVALMKGRPCGANMAAQVGAFSGIYARRVSVIFKTPRIRKLFFFQSSVHHVGSCRGLARWTSSWKCVYGSRDVLDRDEEGSSGDKGGDVGYVVLDHGEDGRAWGSLPWPRRSGCAGS